MEGRKISWEEKNNSIEVRFNNGSIYKLDNIISIVAFCISAESYAAYSFIQKKIHEYEQEKEQKFIHKLNKINHENTKKKSTFEVTNQNPVHQISQTIESTKQLLETTRLILKNNSPIFKMPKVELSKENKLVDKTPIDPYHSWAIVPFRRTI